MSLIYSLKQIDTPRLILRPIRLGDEIAINTAIQCSQSALLPWMPWATDLKLETTRAFVERGVLAWGSGYMVNFPMVVVHKQDNRIIGVSGYNEHSSPIGGVYELGYWCDVKYQGKGYVSEYVNALTQYALTSLGAFEVVARIDIKNTKSINVVRRLNFLQSAIEVPSNTRDGATDYMFVCNAVSQLPPLQVAWFH